MASSKRGGRPIKVTPRKVESFALAWQDLQQCVDFADVVPVQTRAVMAEAADAAEALAAQMRADALSDNAGAT